MKNYPKRRASAILTSSEQTSHQEAKANPPHPHPASQSQSQIKAKMRVKYKLGLFMSPQQQS